jgi:hypothetical protein
VAQQMIFRHHLVEIERVEQLVLWLVVAAHHQARLRQSTRRDYPIRVRIKPSFSTQ